MADSGIEETSDSCPGGGTQLFKASDNTGEITISDAVVCAAGTSTLVFDVGYLGLDNSSFIPSSLSALSVNVIISSGKSVVMRLFSSNATGEFSFARISTLVYVRFLDKGRNVRSPVTAWLSFVHLIFFL